MSVVVIIVKSFCQEAAMEQLLNFVRTINMYLSDYVLMFFAFSTIISWNLFGRINMVYIFGKHSNIIYSIIATVFVFLGSVLSNDLVWELTDTFNQLMVIPNVIAIVALSGLVAKEAKKSKNNSPLIEKK